MIATALKAMADDVEARAASTTSDAHRQPTAEQQAAKADKVRAVAKDLRALAEDAESRSVRFAEFDALRDRLYVLGFALSRKLAEDVATSFRDAEGPAKPRSRGWLKQH